MFRLTFEIKNWISRPKPGIGGQPLAELCQRLLRCDLEADDEFWPLPTRRLGGILDDVR